MTAYYNEFDPYAAEWLRNLIKKGLIADGVVDDRSITSVEASDLGDFTQCHFFAGIGVWSYALRLAGWPDDRPVWTGSCPCQPFSAAGKGKGFEDERHLWPVFHRLIAECRPAVVFGEQVASKDGLNWLDTVFADLEASGYAAGAVDMCAAGIGAPHIRQRLWFVGERLADADRSRSQAQRGQPGEREQAFGSGLAENGAACRLGYTGIQGSPLCEQQDLCGEGRRGEGGATEQPGRSHGGLADAELHEQRQGGRPGGEGAPGHEPWTEPGGCGVLGGAADALGDGRGARWNRDHRRHDGNQPDAGRGDDRPRPTNGFWNYADWLHCRDGKWRPVEPWTFPLAHGAPSRVGRLRAYGNAIVPQVAAEVIGAFMEARP